MICQMANVLKQNKFRVNQGRLSWGFSHYCVLRACCPTNFLQSLQPLARFGNVRILEMLSEVIRAVEMFVSVAIPELVDRFQMRNQNLLLVIGYVMDGSSPTLSYEAATTIGTDIPDLIAMKNLGIEGEQRIM